MKKRILATLIIFLGVSSAQVFAEQVPTTSETQVEMEKVRADKKFMTSKNMQLTDAEAKAFWPLYNEYQTGLSGLNKRLEMSIAEYAELYKSKTMTDAKANKLLGDLMSLEKDELTLKTSMIPKLQKAIPGVKAARYIQIETKVRALIKFELAKRIPLVQ